LLRWGYGTFRAEAFRAASRDERLVKVFANSCSDDHISRGKHGLRSWDSLREGCIDTRDVNCQYRVKGSPHEHHHIHLHFAWPGCRWPCLRRNLRDPIRARGSSPEPQFLDSRPVRSSDRGGLREKARARSYRSSVLTASSLGEKRSAARWTST
jgi:hypothetical protein